MTETTTRPGGHLLVEALARQGVTRVFCVPGESYLAALDGLHSSDIDVVVARQEGGAAMMAEAHGKLLGTPGIAFVTRGPGATNAASGVHVAFQDSTPMILFVGQVGSDQRDREAFQEVDYRAMFAPLAKWAAQIDRVDRIPEYVSRAFHVAQSGRPGPVVLALPEDVLAAPTSAVAAAPAVLPSGAAAERDVAEILDRLRAAARPLVVVGGGGWSAEAAAALGRVALRLGLPVAASFRCQDYLDNDHPCYIGDIGLGANPALAARLRDADVLLALGPRLGEITTAGYTLVEPPEPRQDLIHVHPDPSELGRVYRPSLALAARAASVVRQLDEATGTIDADTGTAVAGERAAYEAWQDQDDTTEATLDMAAIVAELRRALPADAIVTNGAGNYTIWLHRFFRYHRFRSQLAPTSGSMGYGLPAAIAAKLAHPDREVVCLAGDGCFQMVSQEFGTACQHGAAIVVVIVNNGLYGTIRMHQHRTYPGRPVATTLVNPDFAALARAYGGFGATVETTAEFSDALAGARHSGRPSIIDLRVDPAVLTPTLRVAED